MLEHGMIDMVVPRTDMRNTLSRLFKLYTMRDATATPIPADV
jgi:acetyl-CoA carboxylase carboxyl transferase subunit beta